MVASDSENGDTEKNAPKAKKTSSLLKKPSSVIKKPSAAVGCTIGRSILKTWAKELTKWEKGHPHVKQDLKNFHSRIYHKTKNNLMKMGCSNDQLNPAVRAIMSMMR